MGTHNDGTKRRVVVTGYGMVTCLGRNVAETFEAARQARSGIRKITQFQAEGLPCDIAGEVNDAWLPTPPTPLGPWADRIASRATRLMFVAADEAARQADLAALPARERVGCILGTHGDHPSATDLLRVHRAYRKNGEADVAALQAANEYDFLQFYRRKPDACTGLVGCAYGCLGPTFTIVSACAAGAQAIGEAFRAVRRGEADAVLCGGAEAALVYTGYVGFVLLRALCERYRSPETASRPFDRRRNGFVMSEGAAALVLEELGHARSRRAPILGEVVGYGDSADAYRITDVHPNAEGAILAMRGALEDARIWPDQVQYINAHGTSTKLNDQAESYGIRVVFGDSIRHIPASSNKSMLGHAIAAAGAIEAILTLVGMQQSVILPTINYENPDPKCDLPDYVPNEARHCEHSLAISNSFGFGGQNACLCLAAYRGE